MRSMLLVALHALACLGVSLTVGSTALAQSPPKSAPARPKVATAEVDAILKALESGTTSAAPLGSSAYCTPGWVPTFGPQAGLDNVVLAAVQHDDGSGAALYIGGVFRSAGKVEAQGIVRWDGAEFSKVGDFPGRFVRALAVHDDGSGPKLYAAGTGAVLAANGEPLGEIASWDGAQWTSLGGFVDHEIHSLAVFDDGGGARLFAGGDFTTIGGAAASRLARWDGQSWSSVGAAFDATVFAMTVHDDGGGAQLHVAGLFTLPGGSPGDHIARFDGALWSDLGTGDIAGPILSLASFDDGAGPTLWIGGQYTAPSAGVNRLARRTGGVWSQGAPWSGPGRVNALVVHDDGGGAELYAGGQFNFLAGGVFVGNVMRRRSGQWGILDGGLSSAVYALTNFGSPGAAQLFAGGQFFVALDPSSSGGGGRSAPRAALWDGLSWSWPESGIPSTISTLGAYADSTGAGLVAYGWFPSGSSSNLFVGVARRTSSDSWTPLGPELYPAPRVFATHDDGAGARLYAAGQTLISASVGLGPVASFDGVDWQAVGAPQLDNAVYALRTFDDGSGSALYAGGAFTQAGATSVMRVARWDGAQWQPVGAGLPTFAFINAFAVHDDGSGPALFAGGASSGSGPQVAKWDGANWTSVGQDTTAGTIVTSLSSFDDGSGPQLYASGFMETAWGAFVDIARWDGQVWSALPGDLLGSAGRVLAHDDGAGERLYVAGSFGLAGGAGNIQLARFDGADWEVLAQGLGGFEMQLVEYDDGCGPALALAGFQGMEPTGRDGYIARWGCQACGDASKYCTSGTSTSGCTAQIAVGGTASASAPQDFVVLARFVEGDRLGALVYGINGPLAAPFGSSTLCVAPPLQITRVQSSGAAAGGCDGVLVEDWNQFRATHPGALGAPFGVGDEVWAQFWIRDPQSPSTLVTSEAVQFTLAP